MVIELIGNASIHFLLRNNQFSGTKQFFSIKLEMIEKMVTIFNFLAFFSQTYVCKVNMACLILYNYFSVNCTNDSFSSVCVYLHYIKDE